MKSILNLKLVLLLAVIALSFSSAQAADIRTGQDLVSAMHKKYDGKWYKTLTFVQKTIDHKPDGTSETSVWYEAMSVPGKLRIDFDPLRTGGGILFTDGKVFSFRDGKLAGSRPFLHPLLVLGFDVYAQPVEKTMDQLKGLNIDMTVVHIEKWQGRDTYVVGAAQGDLKSPQFWVDKKELYFVRLFELTGKDKKSLHETQFNKYEKAKGGGWVSTEVQFFADGRRTTTELYEDVQTGAALDSGLWDPEKWMTVDREYFKLKK